MQDDASSDPTNIRRDSGFSPVRGRSEGPEKASTKSTNPCRDSGFSPVRGRSELSKPERKDRPHLKSFDYRGHHAYHVTMRTAASKPAFADVSWAKTSVDLLKQLAVPACFDILAFCFMPDHVHLLSQGLTEDADLKKFVSAFKQQTGFRYKKLTGEPLWQVSYFDRVLRRDEDLQTAADYIFTNPVKDGLVEHASSYELSGGIFFDGASADRAEAAVPTNADHPSNPRRHP